MCLNWLSGALAGVGGSDYIGYKVRGGIPRSTEDFPESLSQGISVGIVSVGRLGVPAIHSGPGVSRPFSSAAQEAVWTYLYLKEAL